FMLGALAACGGGGTEAYCDDLEDANGTFRTMDSGDFEDFDQVFPTVQKLADEAPDEVKDDWETLNDALQEMKSALEDAGIEPSDLSDLSSGKLPDGVDQEKLMELPKKMQSLSSTEVQQASDSVAEHAKDTCDVD